MSLCFEEGVSIWFTVKKVKLFLAELHLSHFHSRPAFGQTATENTIFEVPNMAQAVFKKKQNSPLVNDTISHLTTN